MKKFSASILLACVFALLTAERAAATPVTWDFFVNSCTEIIGVGVGCDAKQRHPALLAILTLPGPDSSGSARWDGDPRIPPVYT